MAGFCINTLTIKTHIYWKIQYKLLAQIGHLQNPKLISLKGNKKQTIKHFVA